MRILTIGNMFPPEHMGGYELTWRSWVLAAREQGHDVTVLTTDFAAPGGPDPSLPEIAGVERGLRWLWTPNGLDRAGRTRQWRIERHNLRRLGDALSRVNPDVVAWWAMGGLSLSLIERVRRLGLPAIAVVGDEWPAYLPRLDGWRRALGRLPGAASELLGVPAPGALGPGVRWLFNSAFTRDAALAGSGRFDRVEVVHPGIDPGLFAAAPPRDWSWRLLYVGRIEPRKGTALALELLERIPEATLRLVGSAAPEYGRRLARAAARAGTADRVTIERLPRDELPGVYREADAVLFPVQWEEPWGLVPLEAMAVGRPVIASGTGGSAEYLRDGSNCLIYGPRDDAAALAAAAHRLAADQRLRARLREGGTATVADLTEDAYDRAISRAAEEEAAA